uniref:Uncharacterized protein n=1 Tax=Anguilla anguilla TaxID=7936 RepID=A0A0E9WKE7_ANGAN
MPDKQWYWKHKHLHPRTEEELAIFTSFNKQHNLDPNLLPNTYRTVQTNNIVCY